MTSSANPKSNTASVNSTTTSTPTPSSTPTPAPTPTKGPLIAIVDNTLITLTNGVKIRKPLNLHSVWAKMANVKLGLGMMGISNIDIICTLCLQDISSVCPGFVMPNVSLPQDMFAIDADISVLKEAYAKYAVVFCNVPIADWKTIKQEIVPYLDMTAI